MRYIALERQKKIWFEKNRILWEKIFDQTIILQNILPSF